MNRALIIQEFINNHKNANLTYLEIGVLSGDAFFRIKARNKIAVDPVFSFSNWKRIRYMIKNPSNFNNRFFQMESDHFFERYGDELAKKGIDFSFVDGLHTYAQSLRDTLNCLRYLNQGGAVLLHDCNPTSEIAARPTDCLAELKKDPAYQGAWNGDVWKTIAFLRSTRSDLRIFVLDADFGVGVVVKGEPEGRLHYSVEEIAAMQYEDLAARREEILNLKPVDYLYRFLADRSAVGV
jgi:hypothetical protein